MVGVSLVIISNVFSNITNIVLCTVLLCVGGGQLTKKNIGFGNSFPDSKVHGANMGPIKGRQDPGGPHVCLRNFAIWVGCDNLQASTWTNFTKTHHDAARPH